MGVERAELRDTHQAVFQIWKNEQCTEIFIRYAIAAIDKKCFGVEKST